VTKAFNLSDYLFILYTLEFAKTIV